MTIVITAFYEKWFATLCENAQKVISNYITRIALGNFSNCKAVGEGVHEIKINYQKGYRVYFTNINGEIILLLCAGDKSTQMKDIKKAKAIKNTFLKGERNGK